MITFQTETYADVVGDLPGLLEQHWRELALYQDDIPLDPDYTWYEKADSAGLLRIYTARSGPDLIGYAIFVLIGRHPHYAHRWAKDDIVWIAPEHRNFGVGGGLMDHCEADLKSKGPVVIHVNTKVSSPPLAVLLRSRGYENIELGFSKRFG